MSVYALTKTIFRIEIPLLYGKKVLFNKCMHVQLHETKYTCDNIKFFKTQTHTVHRNF